MEVEFSLSPAYHLCLTCLREFSIYVQNRIIQQSCDKSVFVMRSSLTLNLEALVQPISETLRQAPKVFDHHLEVDAEVNLVVA